MNLRKIYDEINNSVSLIEFTVSNHINDETIEISSNFVIRYFINKMIDDDNHKILNLSSFLYDIVEVESIINEIQQNNKNIEFRYKIFNNIFLYQSLSLIEYHDILDQIVNNKGEDLNIKSIVIQDLDEAFNIASFEDYILAGKTITNIMRMIRKLSQLNDITCILVQRRPRINFNVKHIGKLIRSMMDNQVLIDGSNISIDSVYDL